MDMCCLQMAHSVQYTLKCTSESSDTQRKAQSESVSVCSCKLCKKNKFKKSNKYPTSGFCCFHELPNFATEGTPGTAMNLIKYKYVFAL